MSHVILLVDDWFYVFFGHWDCCYRMSGVASYLYINHYQPLTEKDRQYLKRKHLEHIHFYLRGKIVIIGGRSSWTQLLDSLIKFLWKHEVEPDPSEQALEGIIHEEMHKILEEVGEMKACETYDNMSLDINSKKSFSQVDKWLIPPAKVLLIIYFSIPVLARRMIAKYRVRNKVFNIGMD